MKSLRAEQKSLFAPESTVAMLDVCCVDRAASTAFGWQVRVVAGVCEQPRAIIGGGQRC